MQTVKREKKRSLRAILLILLIVAVILIGSTYAWFISNNTATVSTINVKIETVEGVQISSNGVDWKFELVNADLTEATNLGSYASKAANQLPTILKPVSTGGKILPTGFQEMYLGTIKSNGAGNSILTSSVETGEAQRKGGNYVAFDIFLKLDATSPKTLFLSPGSGVTWDEATAKADTSENGAYQERKYLEYASRVAFVVQGNVPAGTSDELVQGINYNNYSSTRGYYVWEPNYDKHIDTDTVKSATIAKNVMGFTDAELAQAPNPICGVKGTINESANKLLNTCAPSVNSDDTNFKSYSADMWTEEGFSTKKVIGQGNGTQAYTLNPGVTKIRIYMWIEGQDPDCITQASGTYLNFDLKFEVNTRETI